MADLGGGLTLLDDPQQAKGKPQDLGGGLTLMPDSQPQQPQQPQQPPSKQQPAGQPARQEPPKTLADTLSWVGKAWWDVQKAVNLPISSAIEGVGQMSSGLSHLKSSLSSQNDRLTPSASPDYHETARAGGEILGGAMKAGAPLLGVGMAVAPAETAASFAIGMGATKATQAALDKAGIDPAYRDLSADIAGLLAGYATGTIRFSPESANLMEALRAELPGQETPAAASSRIDALKAMAADRSSPNEAQIARRVLKQKYNIDITPPSEEAPPPPPPPPAVGVKPSPAGPPPPPRPANAPANPQEAPAENPATTPPGQPPQPPPAAAPSVPAGTDLGGGLVILDPPPSLPPDISVLGDYRAPNGGYPRSPASAPPVVIPPAGSSGEPVPQNSAAAADRNRPPTPAGPVPDHEELGDRISRMKLPEYVKDTIRGDVASAAGAIPRIEELSAQRRTAGEIARQLDLPGDFQDQQRIVRSVRSVLGIPSMDDKPAFEAWLSSRGAAPSQTGLREAGGEMAGAITGNMYAMLWRKVQAGDVTEGGAPSALLQAAQMARAAGGLQTPEEFHAMAREYADIPRDENFQPAMHGLVRKYSPASEVPAEVPPAQNPAESAIIPNDEQPPGGEVAAVPPADEGVRSPSAAAGPESPASAGQHGYGDTATVIVPGEDYEYPARYAVKELSELTSSHHGFSFQPQPHYPYTNDRDYTKQEGQQRVIMQAQHFKPRYLITDNPDATNGPPVVDDHGNALGGNSRLMTVQRVYFNHPEHADAYRSRLLQQASHYGIKPSDVAGMRQPVLVREIPADHAIHVQKAITDLNKQGVAALGAAERAMVDSRRVTPETLTLIHHLIEQMGEPGSLTKAMSGQKGVAMIDRLISEGAIPEAEKGALVSAGKITAEGKQRVADLMGTGRLKPQTLEDLHQAIEDTREGGSLAQVLAGEHGADIVNRLIADGAATDRDRALYVTDDGKVTIEGKARIGRLMLGRMFGSVGSMDRTPGVIKTKLERMVAPLAAVEPRAGWDLGEVIREAIELMDEARAHGLTNLEDLDAQQAIGGHTRYSPEAYQWAKILKKNGAKKLGDAFRKYADLEGLSRPGANIGMFAPEPVERDVAMQQAFGELKAWDRKLDGAGERAVRSTGPQNESMFGEEAEAESRAVEAHRKAQLLGEQLTAQIRSGLAAKETKVKPAQNRSLFEEGPDQDSLFQRVGPAEVARHGAIERPANLWRFEPKGVERVPGPSLGDLPDHDDGGPSPEQLQQYLQTADSRPLDAGGHPAILVNPAAMDLVTQLLFPRGTEVSTNTYGIALTRSQVVKLVHAGLTAPDTDLGRVVARFGQQIRRATPKGEPLIVVQGGVEMPDSTLTSTVEEEHDHMLQFKLPEGLRSLPAHLLDTPNGVIAIQAMGKRGYVGNMNHPEDRAIMMAEITARLMRPYRWRELGLTAQQARNFAGEIIRALDEQHGPRAAEIVGHMYESIEPNAKAAREARYAELTKGNARSPEAVPGSGRAGPPGWTGQNVPGVQQTLFARRPGDINQIPLAGQGAQPPQPVNGPLQPPISPNATQEQLIELMNRNRAAERAISDRLLADLRARQQSLEDRGFGERLRTWITGTRDMEIAGTNQLRDQLRRALPNGLDQEALTLMRDFRNRPGELEQMLNGSHPYYQEIAKNDGPEAAKDALARVESVRPLIERALQPTPNAQAADRVLTQFFKEHLDEGHEMGFIRSNIGSDEYITHLLQPQADEGIGKRMTRGSRLGPRKFKFANQRFYPTVLHAIANGVKPRTLNALDAMAIYGERYASTRAAHMLIDVLKGTGAGTWGSDAPRGWVELARDNGLFRNDVPFTDTEGNAQIAHQRFQVPPEVDEALKPIYQYNYMQNVPFFMSARAHQTYLKAVELGMSFFHMKALTMMALSNMPTPDDVPRAMMADMEGDDFLQAERNWVRRGLTTPILNRTWEAYKALQPTAAPSRMDVVRQWPVVKQLDRTAQAISHLTFDVLQRKFKVMNAEMLQAAWLAKHPDASPLQLENAMGAVAKELNAVYGGLHWENLGINRMTLELLRAMFLAPDWTFSNTANAKYAIFGAGKGWQQGPAGEMGGDPGARAARMFWAKSALWGFGLTAATTIMLATLNGRNGKKALAEWAKNPTDVYMGEDAKGQRVHQSMFFTGAPGDAVTAVKNAVKYGAVIGVARSIANKVGPFGRTAEQLMSNTDEFGQPIIPRTITDSALPIGPRGGVGRRPPNALEKTGLGVAQAAKNLVPTPFSVSGIARMLVDKRNDWTPQDYASAIINSRPPTHDKPEKSPGAKAPKYLPKTPHGQRLPRMPH